MNGEFFTGHDGRNFRALSSPDVGLPSPEKEKPLRVGIYNETDRLRSAVVYGPPGAEALLAQLHKPEISLFYDDMNVLEARREALSFAGVLNGHGVRTVSVRDRLAASMPADGLTTGGVMDALLKKSHNIQTQTGVFRPAAARQIEELVEADITRYGEMQALALIKRLCLDEELPLGNLIFQRDQMNVLLGTRIVSRMKYPIRQPEVALTEQIYTEILPADTSTVYLPEGETFEGGDAYVHNGTVYMGVGIRTTLGAALHIYRSLQTQLEENGLRFAIVEDPDPHNRPRNEQMDFMHLDTFSGPTGDKKIAVCEEESKRRQVSFVENGRAGDTRIIPTGQSFIDHLQTREAVTVIPRAEQQTFGCNFLAIDGHTLLLPLNSNRVTIQRLEDAGKQIEILDLKESTNGYGAAHCMTGQISRQN